MRVAMRAGDHLPPKRNHHEQQHLKLCLLQQAHLLTPDESLTSANARNRGVASPNNQKTVTTAPPRTRLLTQAKRCTSFHHDTPDASQHSQLLATHA
jgi:hypothetical protein